MFELPSSAVYMQLGLTILIASIIIVILSIMELIGMWCTYQKMGRHDFASLVPGYNLWEYSRGAGTGSVFSTLFVLVFIALLVCLCMYHQAFYTELFSDKAFETNLFLLLAVGSSFAIDLFTNAWVTQFMMHIQLLNPWLLASLILGILFFIMYLRVTYGVSRSFGHGFFFMLGMIILPFIFFPVLGLSKGQRYRGPYFNKEISEEGSDYWAESVEARMQTFGSNAPLALAVCGLIMTSTFMTVPAIILYIIALVRNTANKGKPFAGAKRVGTIVICIVGLLLSVILVVLLVVFGNNLVNLLLML